MRASLALSAALPASLEHEVPHHADNAGGRERRKMLCGYMACLRSTVVFVCHNWARETPQEVLVLHKSRLCVLLSVDGAVRVSQAVSLAIGHIRAHGRFRRYFLHYALIGLSDD